MDENHATPEEALLHVAQVSWRAGQAAQRLHRRVLLTTGTITALCTLLTGWATRALDAGPWVWFLPYAALTLLLRAWILRQPLRSQPSRTLMAALIAGQAVAFGLAAAATPGPWWSWPAAALAQISIYVLAAWRAAR
ncbi:hypothetical protein [Kitasatospora sp. NPDC088346]|uniref:hypothetical protein n=1 Tax=Kitasatospora sp. NPDC088346 TaxID=3364073 RepID=UPI0037F1BE04